MTTKDTLDIVGLIEKNPIIRLSKDYQSKLINKIKTEFTDKNQQLFVTSFYCYLNYNSKNDFIIDLNNVWKWVGFTRKDSAKKLIEKVFIKDIDYKILLRQLAEQDLQHGGSNKETILMTINTFKKFCLKAGTEKADEIHDYYIKLEEILHQILDEETTELKEQLKLKNEELISKDLKYNKQIKFNKQSILIEKMKGKRCVYIAEIEDNKFIKIGSTKEIYERYKQLNKQYGNCLFLDIFEHDNYRDVEESILKDENILKYIHREKINGHMPQEIVKISNEFKYEQILSIVKKYLSNGYLLKPEQLLEKQKIEFETKKLELEQKKIEIDLLKNIISNDLYSETVKTIIGDKLPDILENIKINKGSINISPETDINDKTENTNHAILPIIDIDNRITQNPNYNMIHDIKVKGRKPKGRKIQKIDPNNLSSVIKVYDSIAYLIRAPENKGMQKSSIQNSIKKNYIYKGFRWNYVENGEDPMISKVGPTVKCNQPIVCSILKLNETKTEILDSYATKDIAAAEIKISKRTIRNIILNGTMINNCYYIELDKCPNELLNKYKKPINRLIAFNSKPIKQINPITGESIIFNTMSEISNKLGISSSTLIGVIESKSSYGGFLWEYYNNQTQ